MYEKKLGAFGRRLGDDRPLPDDPDQAGRIKNRFGDMSMRDALDLDGQVRGAERSYDLADSLIASTKGRMVRSDATRMADNALRKWQDGVLLYQHARPLWRPMRPARRFGC